MGDSPAPGHAGTLHRPRGCLSLTECHLLDAGCASARVGLRSGAGQRDDMSSRRLMSFRFVEVAKLGSAFPAFEPGAAGCLGPEVIEATAQDRHRSVVRPYVLSL